MTQKKVTSSEKPNWKNAMIMIELQMEFITKWENLSEHQPCTVRFKGRGESTVYTNRPVPKFLLKVAQH